MNKLDQIEIIAINLHIYNPKYKIGILGELKQFWLLNLTKLIFLVKLI